MSESKHTPGPWEIVRTEPSSHGVGRFKIISGQWSVAETFCGINEEEANARLIAAAPDLLEACEASLNALVGIIESDYQTRSNPRPADNDPAVVLLRAAIAKAKGENS